MKKLLVLLTLHLFLIGCTSTNKNENAGLKNSIPVSDEQIMFANLMDSKPADIEVHLINSYFFGRLKTSEQYVMCISEKNYNDNPLQTYIKLINMSDIEEFNLFNSDSVFNAPFKNGTLHSIEFKNDHQIITQIKNFEGKLISFRSYKKENKAWELISAGFYTYKEEYVYPFN